MVPRVAVRAVIWVSLRRPELGNVCACKRAESKIEVGSGDGVTPRLYFAGIAKEGGTGVVSLREQRELVVEGCTSYVRE
jgi:hypothetical protein